MQKFGEVPVRCELLEAGGSGKSDILNARTRSDQTVGSILKSAMTQN